MGLRLLIAATLLGAGACPLPCAEGTAIAGWCGRFVGGPPMLQARTSGFTATVLNDGRVVVVGGNGDDDAATSAEIFAPNDDAFVAAASPLRPRASHAAVLLDDGRVLVSGGSAESPPTAREPSTTEIFDPAANAWAPGPAHVGVLSAHSLHLHATGRVVAIGLTTEMLEPGATAWTTGPTSPTPRTLRADVRVDDDTVAVIGGADFNDDVVQHDEVEVLNLVDLTWTARAPLRDPRFRMTALTLAPGVVLVAGGADDALPSPETTERYDSNADRWTALGPMRQAARQEGVGVVVDDDVTLVIGGRDQAAFLDSTEVFDIGAGTFTVGPPLTAPRTNHAAIVVDGSVFVFGGTVNGDGGDDDGDTELLLLEAH